MEKAVDSIKMESQLKKLVRLEYMNIRQSEWDKKAEGIKVSLFPAVSHHS